MEKINIVICTGTACYVMGAGSLLSVKDEIESELSQRIEVSGCSCMGLCKTSEKGNAPFAKVNDTVIADATVQKLAEEIRKQT
ncbi:MAG: NAD(P)H-dependent oxidoreductase subunit E [Chitinivibrionales bacterium]